MHLIAKLNRYEGEPSLAPLPQGFGIAWFSKKPGASTTGIFYARLGGDGRRLGDPVMLTSGPDSASYPSLAWSGSKLAVAWRSYQSSGWKVLYLTFVNTLGTRVGEVTRMTDPSRDIDMVGVADLAYDGKGLGVVWWERETDNSGPGGAPGDGHVMFARLDASGKKLGADRDLSGANYGLIDSYPTVVWTGKGYGVGWRTYTGIYFRPLDGNGKPTSSGPLNISSIKMIYGQQIGLFQNGENFDLFWNDVQSGSKTSTLKTARVLSNSAQLPTVKTLRVDPHGANWYSIAASGQNYGVVWTDNRKLTCQNGACWGNTELYFLQLDSSLKKVHDNIQLTNTKAPAGTTSNIVVRDGAHTLAWTEAIDSNTDGLYVIQFRCTR